MNLPLAMICPSHGVIWRRDPASIVQQYLLWADAYAENQITIVYDTMWNGTRAMAEAIARGIEAADGAVTVKLFNAAKFDKNNILTEIFHSKALLLGSPTINNGYSYAVAGLLEMVKGLKLKKKSAAAFGCYGWSGEGVKLLSEHLAAAGFNIVDEGIRAQWNPDAAALTACEQYGKAFVSKLQ
ncbi:MAG: flavodoxin domain-containing protein, partial [Bacteroidales bacterium]|nr:flavodoxin domain-containing protein [Bacteroidales bacterium]